MMAKNLNQASQRKIHDDYHLHEQTAFRSVFACLFLVHKTGTEILLSLPQEASSSLSTYYVAHI